MKKIARTINCVLNQVGIHLISAHGWRQVQKLALERDELLNQNQLAHIDLKLISLILRQNRDKGGEHIRLYLEHRENATAAFRQDMVALVLNGFKNEGIFIEVGACDGIATSNTLLLEKAFGWRGILIEPARIWQKALQENRNVSFDFRCAWNENGNQVLFAEKSSPGRSGIVQTATDNTQVNNTYAVETVTIKTILLEKPNLQEVDFLSVDTEGSELEVLLGFPFESCRPKFVCVEHNFEKDKRIKIRQHLAQFGYRIFMENESFVDDWFVYYDEKDVKS